MRSLIRGQAFTLACKLGNNGNYTQAKALIDTGANGTLFIQRKLVYRLVELFEKEIKQAKDTCLTIGYNS